MNDGAQNLINEIEREQKELAIYKKIKPETLKKWGVMGIEIYTDENEN